MAAVVSPNADEVVAALHRFGLQRDRFRTALARRVGIALADLDALEYLERDGPLSQRELGERLRLSSGAVTFLVDRLERAGLLRREPHPTDRRATLVALRPDADMPSVPELDEYHAATHRAAAALSAAGRTGAVTFLASVTAEATAAANALGGRPRSKR